MKPNDTVYYVDYQTQGFPVVPIKYRDFVHRQWNGRVSGKIPLEQKSICHETMTGAELERAEYYEERGE